MVGVAFLPLAFGRLAFNPKTNHHFNKNLDAQRGSAESVSRNSGNEGTKFIGLNRSFFNFWKSSKLFLKKTKICVREKQSFLSKGNLPKMNGWIDIEFKAGKIRTPRTLGIASANFPRKGGWEDFSGKKDENPFFILHSRYPRSDRVGRDIFVTARFSSILPYYFHIDSVNFCGN